MTFDEAARHLAAVGIESPRAEARLLLAHALGVSRDETLSPSLVLMPEQSARFEAMVLRRAAREPSAYITGVKEFWSLKLAVGAGVLVPRPETETLIEEALRALPDRIAKLRIADFGTGSGALLLAALTEFPNATGVGFESSPEAFAWAKRNLAAHASERGEIRLADWNQAEGPFDLIFCNPPYIPAGEIAGLDPEVAGHEPGAALDGGADGLACYRGLAGLLPGLVAPGGWAILEIGAGQAGAVELLFPGPDLKLVKITPDLAGIPRAVLLEKA